MVGGLACGGDDLTLPSEAMPADLEAVAGNGQQGPVGAELPDPITVRLTDARGRSVVGATIAFRFTGGPPGADLDPEIVPTVETGWPAPASGSAPSPASRPSRCRSSGAPRWTCGKSSR